MATSDRHRRPAVGVDHPTVVPTNLEESADDAGGDGVDADGAADTDAGADIGADDDTA